MIYVSQGHEKGIGLEVFLKSFLLLSENEQAQFILVSKKETLEINLKILNLSYSIDSDFITLGRSRLNTSFLSNLSSPESTESLLKCLELIDPTKDLLLTLPTSKDQLIYNKQSLAGHTEFFRAFYNAQNIVMVFRSPNENNLLVTDHLPLKDVASSITEEMIVNKVLSAINSYQSYFSPISKIYLAGINPHCGENGLLGLEDQVIISAINSLRQSHKELQFKGPLPGDTLHLYPSGDDSLFVYMYHDQALTRFKSTNQFIGANISFGLPFLRISVDHGTAFELFGKNIVNFSGSLFTLKLATEAQFRIRNS